MEFIVIGSDGAPVMRTNSLACMSASQIKDQRRTGYHFRAVAATPEEQEALLQMGLRKAEIECLT